MKEKNDPNRFTLRLPEPLRERIAADAVRNGRTTTAEIVARLEQLPVIDLLQDVLRENAEIKATLRLLLHERQ